MTKIKGGEGLGDALKDGATVRAESAGDNLHQQEINNFIEKIFMKSQIFIILY